MSVYVDLDFLNDPKIITTNKEYMSSGPEIVIPDYYFDVESVAQSY